jgi:hypothetical protein
MGKILVWITKIFEKLMEVPFSLHLSFESNAITKGVFYPSA